MLLKKTTHFRALFEGLVAYGLSRGVPFEDAQDLVCNSIEAAYKGFDPERGEFAALCYTTLSNRIKNYWRARKPTEPLAEDDNLRDPSPGESLRDDVEYDNDLLEQIMADLTVTERDFLVEMRLVLEELEGRAVSETSRRLGIAPEKGWDIFRRIQRKAQRLSLPPRSVSRPAVVPVAVQTEPPKDASTRKGTVMYCLVPSEAVSPEIRLLSQVVSIQGAFDAFASRLNRRDRSAIEMFLLP
jgi:DNA-directed RNA polymerase specialized sigma24 family protein